jgi:hypothetical protein
VPFDAPVIAFRSDSKERSIGQLGDRWKVVNLKIHAASKMSKIDALIGAI